MSPAQIGYIRIDMSKVPRGANLNVHFHVPRASSIVLVVGSGMERLALTLQKWFAEAQRDSKWIGDFPLLVNEVCVGLGGFRKFMNYAGVDYDTRCCDKEARYKRFYEELVKEDPEAYLETNIGADGDLLLASDAGDADGVVGGVAWLSAVASSGSRATSTLMVSAWLQS